MVRKPKRGNQLWCAALSLPNTDSFLDKRSPGRDLHSLPLRGSKKALERMVDMAMGKDNVEYFIIFSVLLTGDWFDGTK